MTAAVVVNGEVVKVTPLADGAIEISSEGERTLILLPKAAKCGCGRAAVMFVNRAGRSRCVSCDYLFKEEQRPATLVPPGSR